MEKRTDDQDESSQPGGHSQTQPHNRQPDISAGLIGAANMVRPGVGLTNTASPAPNTGQSSSATTIAGSDRGSNWNDGAEIKRQKVSHNDGVSMNSGVSPMNGGESSNYLNVPGLSMDALRGPDGMGGQQGLGGEMIVLNASGAEANPRLQEAKQFEPLPVGPFPIQQQPSGNVQNQHATVQRHNESPAIGQEVQPDLLQQQQQQMGQPISFLPVPSSLHLQSILLQSQLQQMANPHMQQQLSPQQMAMQQQYLQQAALLAGLNPNFAQSLATQHQQVPPAAPASGRREDAANNSLVNMLDGAASSTAAGPGGSSQNGVKESLLTGRSHLVLYMSCDDDALSEYQCLVRKNIELFEANSMDVDSNAQGRNRPIVLGQVGIRCRHCSVLPPKHRARGAIYYPAKLEGLYQAAQNQANGHLAEHCNHMPPMIRSELQRLKDRKSSAGGGKKYWADGVRVLGVFEDAHGLRFERR